MTDEELRPIPGYPGYSVTRDGRVQGLKGTWMHPRTTARGYKEVGCYVDKTPKYVGVHRLVLLAWVGPCPPGMQSCHNDGNAGNNYLENLRWDTRSENALDRTRHGTSGRPACTKLTVEEVKLIRELARKGDIPQREIGERFGVTQSNVHLIHKRVNWSHLSD